MAYNNGYPITYPQYYPQFAQPQVQAPQPQPTTPQPQPQQSNIIWVQGDAGAKSYLVAPNTTVQLWDSERQTIYLKSADASGMPTMKTLDYTIREQAQPQSVPVVSEQAQPKGDFVTHQELKDFEDKMTHKIDELKEEVSA